MLISNGKIEQVFKMHLHKVYGTRIGSSAPAEKTDNLSLSARATEIQGVKQHVSTMPEVRSDKVNTYSDMIANGTYTPSDEDIADAILGSVGY